MYSKDELSDKNTSELQDIATGLGLNVQDYTNNDELVYAILDRQAEVEGNKNPLGGTKRRRTRIVKKDTDKEKQDCNNQQYRTAQNSRAGRGFSKRRRHVT